MRGAPLHTHLLCISPDAPTNPVLYWLGGFDAVATRFLLDGAKGPLRLDLGDTLYAPNLMLDEQALARGVPSCCPGCLSWMSHHRYKVLASAALQPRVSRERCCLCLHAAHLAEDCGRLVKNVVRADGVLCRGGTSCGAGCRSGGRWAATITPAASPCPRVLYLCGNRLIQVPCLLRLSRMLLRHKKTGCCGAPSCVACCQLLVLTGMWRRRPVAWT